MNQVESNAPTVEPEPTEIQLRATKYGTAGGADVVCSLGDETIHRDRLTLAKSGDRKRFANEVISKLGESSAIGFDAIQAELLGLADRLDDTIETNGDHPSSQTVSLELPASRFMRPELIVHKDITAIAVPTLMQAGDRVIGEWIHCVQTAEGRSCEPLSDRLAIPNSDEAWLSPMPTAPNAGDVRDFNGWSLQSRGRWMAGEPAPTTEEVLDRVARRIERYVVLPSEYSEEHKLTLAAWVMMTYVYPALPAVPYVYLSGPANSGKTRTMDVLSRMVFRPMMTGNATAATIFRTRHAYGGTMLLDEVERMGDSRSPDVLEIRSILLSGYRRGGRATRMEPYGDSYRAVSFDCYGPVVFGAIRGLPHALASRCITFRLFRATKGDVSANRSLDDSPLEEVDLRDALHRWALGNGFNAISTALPANSLANRDAELWGPLLRIIAHAGQTRALDAVIRFAEQMALVSLDDSTPEADPILLDALSQLLQQGKEPKAGDVLYWARMMHHDTIDDKWTPRGVAGILKRYDIRTMKTNGQRLYRVSAEKVVEIGNRYGFDLKINRSEF